jgi:hypothetical protein
MSTNFVSTTGRDTVTMAMRSMLRIHPPMPPYG